MAVGKARCDDEVLAVVAPPDAVKRLLEELDRADKAAEELHPVQRAPRHAQLVIIRSIVNLLGDGGIPLNQCRAAIRALNALAFTQAPEAQHLQTLVSELEVRV